MTTQKKTLRKVIIVGSSKLITLPPDFDASYVWLVKDDNKLVIEPAKVI